MTAEAIAGQISCLVKLVRGEYDLSQEKMAGLLGLSKKTLIQVEKGRRPMQWSAVVTLCALFNDSNVLSGALGDWPLEVVKAAIFPTTRFYPRTMGGKIWWRELSHRAGFRLQQNLVSGHFRIIDKRNQRWFSSFDLKENQKHLESLASLTEGGIDTCLQQ